MLTQETLKPRELKAKRVGLFSASMPKAYGTSHKRQTRPDTGPRRVRGPYALGGCLTCRRRHVKCDQVKPVCLTCQACGETCDGFSDDLCWVGASSSSKRESPTDPSQGSRRHLYTGEIQRLGYGENTETTMLILN